MSARPVIDLPEPDSPTMPSFSRPSVKLMPRTAETTPRGREVDAQVACIDHRGVCDALCVAAVMRGQWESLRGSSTSRSASPNRLKARLTTAIARPGAATTQGLSNMNSRPAETIAPHSGQGGCGAESEEAKSCCGQDHAGHVQRDAHDDGRQAHGQDVASDDSRRRGALQAHRGDEIRLRRLSASARASRAIGGHAVSEIAMMALVMPGPRAAAKPSARMRPGNDRKMSVIRIRTSSHRRRDSLHSCTDEEADRRDDDRDQHDDVEGRARAVDDAREHVATEIVGAEPVLCRRRQEYPRHVLEDRIVGGDPAARELPSMTSTAIKTSPTRPSGCPESRASPDRPAGFAPERARPARRSASHSRVRLVRRSDVFKAGGVTVSGSADPGCGRGDPRSC